MPEVCQKSFILTKVSLFSSVAPNQSFGFSSHCRKNRETSDKAFKAIVTIQPLSDLLFQILKHAVPIDGSSPASSSKIPANVALSAGEFLRPLPAVLIACVCKNERMLTSPYYTLPLLLSFSSEQPKQSMCLPTSMSPAHPNSLFQGMSPNQQRTATHFPCS